MAPGNLPVLNPSVDVGLILDQQMRGELGLVSLRVMCELGVRHGVPFDIIKDEDLRYKLPEDLQSIATQILEQALSGYEVSLDSEQELLLRGRYIHQSAHWLPTAGLMVNKPAQGNRRNVYPDEPQKGYPE